MRSATTSSPRTAACPASGSSSGSRRSVLRTVSRPAQLPQLRRCRGLAGRSTPSTRTAMPSFSVARLTGLARTRLASGHERFWTSWDSRRRDRLQAPVDAVVVTWNSRETALRCLEHLAAVPVERVILVDNASADGTADAVDPRVPRSSWWSSSRNTVSQPHTTAARPGVRAAGALPQRRRLRGRRGCARARVRARPASLRGRGGRKAGRSRRRKHAGRVPAATLPDARFLAAMLAGRERIPVDLSDVETVVVDQPPGACLLVRRAAIDDAGGWDEDFEFWYEDVDLARRLKARGEVLYVPAAGVAHAGGQSARRLSRAGRLAPLPGRSSTRTSTSPRPSGLPRGCSTRWPER